MRRLEGVKTKMKTEELHYWPNSRQLKTCCHPMSIHVVNVIHWKISKISTWFVPEPSKPWIPFQLFHDTAHIILVHWHLATLHQHFIRTFVSCIGELGFIFYVHVYLSVNLGFDMIFAGLCPTATTQSSIYVTTTETTISDL